MAGLYLHIPFCRKACHYCDFHFSTQRDIQAPLIAAIADELRIRQNYLQGERVATIYYGGGTPSLMTRHELLLLAGTIEQIFHRDPHLEVTYEVNPDDLSEKKLEELLEAGANRLSIGIQSFSNDVLEYFNRSHDAASALGSVETARNAGFTNVSIDLIFAVPGQSRQHWVQTVETAIGLNPDHISAYSLTLEDHTVFGRWHKQGKLSAVTEDEAAAQLDLLCDLMESAGYSRYEVSNFARPGFESGHNTGYWRLEKYLGVGPGAHSFNLTSRQWNVRNNNQYLKCLKEGHVSFEKEELTLEERINDYLLTSLRTRTGCSLEVIKNSFGLNLAEKRGEKINELVGRGLAVLSKDTMRLTRSGLLLADRIAMELFL